MSASGQPAQVHVTQANSPRDRSRQQSRTASRPPTREPVQSRANGHPDPIESSNAHHAPAGATGREPRFSSKLGREFDQALANPYPIDLQPDIARLDALIAREWEQLVAGPPSPGTDAQRALHAYQEAIATGNAPRAQKAWATYCAIVDREDDTAKATQRLLTLIDLKRRLIETHVKIEKTLSRFVTLDEVGDVLQIIATAMRRAVPDPAVRQRIFDDIQAACKTHDMPCRVPTGEPDAAAASPSDTQSAAYETERNES